ELGDPVDDHGDLGAELAIDVGQADFRVLDGVVEEGGGQGGVVEADVSDDVGHGQRVVDVLLPRLAVLALVGAGGNLEGAQDGGRGRLGVVGAVGGNERRHLFGGL